MMHRLILLLTAIALTATLITPARAQTRELAEALEPLRAAPVQDFGIVRSAHSYGDNPRRGFCGKPRYGGVDGLTMMIWLMAHHEAAPAEPIIRLQRPELIDIYGTKWLSAEIYSRRENQIALMQLYRTDVERWNETIGLLQTKVHDLEHIGEGFNIVPREGEWVSAAYLPTLEGGDPLDTAILLAWMNLMQAVATDNYDGVTASATELNVAIRGAAEARGIVLPRLGVDAFYHRHQPFHRSAWFYVLASLAFGLVLVAGRQPKHAGWRRWVVVGAFALMILGLAEQILGLSLRWVLAGRAPVSNMYESFTFATTAMVAIALIFEWRTRTLLVGLGGAVLGAIAMILAHKAPIFDSQIRPLIPALQSSWLTYHVIAMLLSYGAFAVSFAMAAAYLIKDALGGDRARLALVRHLPSMRALDTLTYRVIAVGFPLLTIGIITGAIWAATAWGRPWGFDPKETWSAITWIVYAIYVHVRLLAGWRGRRAAILAIVGFVSVLVTYVGVNFLMSGLHSYV